MYCLLMSLSSSLLTNKGVCMTSSPRFNPSMYIDYLANDIKSKAFTILRDCFSLIFLGKRKRKKLGFDPVLYSR